MSNRSSVGTRSIRPFDVVVVGGGVAGGIAALRLAERSGASVGLITKAGLGIATTRLAQGGIAVAGFGDDDPDLHFQDTMSAGAGLCDEDATRVLVEEGVMALDTLIAAGAVFDRSDSGELSLSKEGGHSVARVVHSGGAATGAEVIRTITAAIGRAPIDVLDHVFAVDLLIEADRCHGVVALNQHGEIERIEAAVVVLATGGAGQLFDVTTNPVEATGDGLAMALRAGVPVADLEFVQFHPTALAIERWPRPLLSEALHGAGAKLRNAKHDRFVDELAPRDVVSRAIAAQMLIDESSHVSLDVTEITDFAGEFPSLAAVLSDVGLDPPPRDMLPVAPAAHYLSGGILTDLDGASAIKGLFAVGEVACSGVEGANRLASNSLLEGLVFGMRAAEVISAGRDEPRATGAIRGLVDPTATGGIEVRMLRDVVYPTNGVSDKASNDLDGESRSEDVPSLRRSLQQTMSVHAGVVRDEQSLHVARLKIESVWSRLVAVATQRVGDLELANLAAVASALVFSALARQESRGAHTCADYPDRDDVRFCCRLALSDKAPVLPLKTRETVTQ